MKHLILILFVTIEVIAQSDSVLIDNFTKQLNKKNDKLIGLKYPSFYVKNDDGSMNNDKILGKIVLINFWTTFCRPCIAEMPSLNVLYNKYKNQSKFVFLSFTSDDELMIKSLKKEHNIEYNIYSLLRAECYRLNLQNGFPTTIIIDEFGKVNYIKSGGSSNPEKAKEIIEQEIEPVLLKILKN